MTNKRKTSPGTLRNLILLIPNLINFATNITALLRMEACLAGKNIIILLVLGIVLACVLSSTWLCMLAMLLAYLLSIQWSWLSSLSVIFILNLFLLLLVAIIIVKTKRNLLH
jgi:hypothetical protein